MGYFPYIRAPLFLILMLILMISPPAEGSMQSIPAEAVRPIRVAATFPVLKDLVEQIAQDRVHVTSLLSGLESEHTYTPKPSDILEIRQSRLLIQIGLGLEVWVEDLIRNADNPDLTIVTTSRGVSLIQHDAALDEHGLIADPHIWLDPENAIHMTGPITEALVQIDPQYEYFYRKNQADYIIRLTRLQNRLLEEFRALGNRKIVTHHRAWSYFARRFGLDIRDTIVSQVGAEPSAKRLAGLIRLIRDEDIRLVVSEPQLNPKLPEMLARETGAKVVVLTPIPGALEDVPSYEAMIEYNARQLLDGLAGASGE